MDRVDNLLESHEVRAAAAEALSQMTGIRGYGEDPAMWDRWWAPLRGLSPAQFSRDLEIERTENFTGRYAAVRPTSAGY